MTELAFPSLPLAGWWPTRDTLQGYARLLGKVRQAMLAPQPHWQHVSLRVVPDGLTTGPIPIPDTQGQTFEMVLGLGPGQGGHRLIVQSSHGERFDVALHGQSPRHYADAALAFLAAMGLVPGVDREILRAGTTPGAYDTAAVECFSRALVRVAAALEQLKGELPGHSSPVQFWTHHFDLALMWLSGRHVPGVDPADEEQADEQIAFGFSTGDEGTPDPYLYVTAYPWPEGLEQEAAPAGGTWHTTGWRGAQLMTNGLAQVDDPQAVLLEFLRSAYRATSARQQDVRR